VAQAADTAPPTGSIALVDNVTLTKTSAVTLALSASDPSGVSQMCVSNTTSCSTFVPYATRLPWTLAPSGTTATVRAWFKDVAGNRSVVPAIVTVGFDATAPTNGTVTAAAGNARVTLSWTGFSDGGSGLQGTILVSGPTAPANCSTGTVLARGTATTFAHTGLTNGTAVGYRVCGVDVAGNISSGVAATARPVPETTPPTGTVAIAGAPGPVKRSTVQLTLTARDASPVTQMCVSNGATCTAFTPFLRTTTWTLASGTGLRTVNVWFRDTWGNASPAPVSASITVDSALPTGGAVVATPGSRSVSLSWSGFADVGSGVVGYTLVSGTTAPANCTTGTVRSTGSATSFSQTGLTASVRVGYRVCAVDGAGNVSGGVTVLATPTP
jgi:hypothetical protein